MFVKREKYENLKKENENLKTKVAALEQLAEERIKKINEMQEGHLCDGPYCSSCEFFGGDRLRRVGGVFVVTDRCCLKDVPCPDFKQAKIL